MALYRPRMWCYLDVPIYGAPGPDRKLQAISPGVITIEPTVASATWERNDPNTADSLKLELSWDDSGVDPRFIKNAVVRFYMGDENASNGLPIQAIESNRRFVGIATNIERQLSSDKAGVVSVDALDFTTLMIETKPCPSLAIPHWSDSLDIAWDRLCEFAIAKSATGVQFQPLASMKGHIKVYGADISPWPVIGNAMSDRFKAIGGTIDVQPGCSVWDVWKRACGLCGLITWIDQDFIVVSTSASFYTDGPQNKNRPVMVWGKNVLEMSERIDCNRFGKKVGIVSFDPTTGRSMEAFYPHKRNHLTKKMAAADKKAGDSDEYVIFEYYGVSNQDRLDEIAKRIYEEWSLNELEGTLITKEMVINSANGNPYDLMALRSGDNMQVIADRNDYANVAALPTMAAKLDYLTERGYSDSSAQILINATMDLATLDNIYYVKRVSISFSIDGDSGKFQVEIGYLNRLHADDAGTDTPNLPAQPDSSGGGGEITATTIPKNAQPADVTFPVDTIPNDE